MRARAGRLDASEQNGTLTRTQCARRRVGKKNLVRSENPFFLPPPLRRRAIDWPPEVIFVRECIRMHRNGPDRAADAARGARPAFFPGGQRGRTVLHSIYNKRARGTSIRALDERGARREFHRRGT